MYAGSDDIPLLACASITGLRGYRNEVFTEIARGGVDRQALTVGSLDFCGREGAGSSVVANLSLCYGCRIKDSGSG